MFENMNIFEYAVANKLRFPYKGSVSTEDLYDLSVTELDSIYKNLKREVKKANEDSLLVTQSKEDIVLDIKIEIVKFIVTKKLTQAEAKKKEKENKEKRERLLEIKAQRENAALENMSDEELDKALAELEN